MPATEASNPPRRRVPAGERRVELIDAAVVEFAHGGLHGTPVDRIARRVGVAQPYVFSLFGSKRELFLAAVEQGFATVEERFARAAAAFDPETAGPEEDVVRAIGESYIPLVAEQPHLLMLQHQAYAACDDPEIRARVRAIYARLVRRVEELTHAEPERIDEFFRYGMWLNVAAALGVEDLSSRCDWMREERRGDQ